MAALEIALDGSRVLFPGTVAICLTFRQGPRQDTGRTQTGISLAEQGSSKGSFLCVKQKAALTHGPTKGFGIWSFTTLHPSQQFKACQEAHSQTKLFIQQHPKQSIQFFVLSTDSQILIPQTKLLPKGECTAQGPGTGPLP